MNLWLDDVRDPINFNREGWWWVKTVEEAKKALLTGEIENASLDHDLGACDACMDGLTPWGWLVRTNGQSMPHCEHVGDGTQLCNWMAETGNWPKTKPSVHSANSVGRKRMQGIIDRYWEPSE